MHSFLAVLFSLLFLLNKSLANQEDDFLKVCPPSTCGSGSGSLQIRFPLRLGSAPASCGLPGLDLTCSGDDTLLSIPSRAPLANLTTPVYSPVAQLVSWARCSTEFVPCSGPNCGEVAGPAPSCFADTGYFVYAVYEYETMDALPRDCEVFQTGGEIPDLGSAFQRLLDVFGERREVVLSWYVDGEAGVDCGDCERGGRQCGFDFARNRSFCISHQQRQHHGENTCMMSVISAGVKNSFTFSKILFLVT